MDGPPPRKRICLGLNMPEPAEGAKQSVAERRRDGQHVTLCAVAPRVDNYMVRQSPPPVQGSMDGNFYAMVREGWEKSPRMATGITTQELKRCGISRPTQLLKRTAEELGAASLDHLFPWIRRSKCRPDQREELGLRARVVPVWLLVFLLARVRKSQFSKFNDRFRILFDLFEDLQEGATNPRTGILEHVPLLVRESIVLAARKADQVLEAYQDTAVRTLNAELPVLGNELRTLRSKMDGMEGMRKDVDEMRQQLGALLDAS